MPKAKTRTNWKLAAERAGKQLADMGRLHHAELIRCGQRIAELERERDIQSQRADFAIENRNYWQMRCEESEEIGCRAESFPPYRAWQWLKRKFAAEVQRGR